MQIFQLLHFAIEKNSVENCKTNKIYFFLFKSEFNILENINTCGLSELIKQNILLEV